jgi:hypothetical protein
MFDLTFCFVAMISIFGGGLLGLLLGHTTLGRYLDESTHKIVQIAMGTISVMVALVISLMMAQARNILSSRDRQVEQLATDLIVLDRELLRYGSETQDAHRLLRQYTALKIKLTWPASGSGTMLDSPQSLHLIELVQDRLLELQPKSAAQRAMLASALQISNRLIETRWTLAVEHGREIPRAFLYAVVFWLTILFISFGMFAPRNRVVVASLFVCALCLCVAILLIMDMDEPFGGIGFIMISPEPMQHALASMPG